MTGQWQLREYRIDADHFEEFVSAWRAGVAPLRRRFGFRVLAWSIPEESRFMWLLGYSGPESFGEADARYYASPERAALTPDPAQWIIDKRERMLSPVVTEE